MHDKQGWVQYVQKENNEMDKRMSTIMRYNTIKKKRNTTRHGDGTSDSLATRGINEGSR